MRQLLKEVEYNVLVVVLILVHELCHFLLGLFSALDQLEELVELNVHVIIDSCHHFFDLLSSVYKTERDQGVF